MIVQPPSPTKDLCNEGDEFLIDFEKILFLARKRAWILALAGLAGVAIGLAYAVPRLSQPTLHIVEQSLGFSFGGGMTGMTGLTGLTGVPGIDAELDAFSTSAKWQENVKNGITWDQVVQSCLLAGLQVVDPEKIQKTLSTHPSPEVTLEVTRRGSAGQKVVLKISASKNESSKIAVRSQGQKDMLLDLLNGFLVQKNRDWGQQVYDLAKQQVPKAEIELKKLKELSAEIDLKDTNYQALARQVQYVADINLLSTSKRRVFLNDFIRMVKDWPPFLPFIVPLETIWKSQQTNPLLWALPALGGAGLLLTCLAGIYFLDPTARRLLSQQDVAHVFPGANIIDTTLSGSGLANLKILLSASLARQLDHRKQSVAILLPLGGAQLEQSVRDAAKAAGLQLVSNLAEAKSKESGFAVVHQTTSPALELAGLASAGIGRVVLNAELGRTIKSDAQLLQSAINLSGLCVSDVIFIVG